MKTPQKGDVIIDGDNYYWVVSSKGDFIKVQVEGTGKLTSLGKTGLKDAELLSGNEAMGIIKERFYK